MRPLRLLVAGFQLAVSPVCFMTSFGDVFASSLRVATHRCHRQQPGVEEKRESGSAREMSWQSVVLSFMRCGGSARQP